MGIAETGGPCGARVVLSYDGSVSPSPHQRQAGAHGGWQYWTTIVGTVPALKGRGRDTTEGVKRLTGLTPCSPNGRDDHSWPALLLRPFMAESGVSIVIAKTKPHQPTARHPTRPALSSRRRFLLRPLVFDQIVFDKVVVGDAKRAVAIEHGEDIVAVLLGAVGAHQPRIQRLELLLVGEVERQRAFALVVRCSRAFISTARVNSCSRCCVSELCARVAPPRRSGAG